MKRTAVVFAVSLLALLLVPVFIAQLRPPERRQLGGVQLSDVIYDSITFENEEHDLTLGGMLFIPDGQGPFPAAVIIHGSGPSSRDNRWYLTLVEYLRSNGVVVLLPDKRGCERSEGEWRTASFDDLATDTEAALEFLQRYDEVPVSLVGVIGMSQGGQIAPLVAAERSDLDFVVNVVGGAVPMYRTLVYEENHNIRQMGVLPGFSNVLAYPAAWSLIYIRQRDFWSAVGNYDPLPYWDSLDVESLVLYGAEDTNVPSARSAARLRSLGNSPITVKVYPGSGHALESPVGEGDAIIRREALEDVLNFIRSIET